MAAQTFVTKIIDNAKPEADWLANETYFLLPNETVEAYTIQTVSVDGEDKNMLFLRSKTNTTTGKKLFKELPYNDEYLMYTVQDNINTAVDEIQGQITNINTEITNIKNDIGSPDGSISASLSALEEKVDKNTTDIGTTNTTVTGLSGTVSGIRVDLNMLTPEVTEIAKTVGEHTTNIATNTDEINKLKESVGDLGGAADDIVDLKKKVSDNTTNISTNTGNITTLQTDVTTHSGDISTLKVDVAQNKTDISNKANIASPTFTGTPAAPTAAKGTNTTQIATTAFVQAAQTDLASQVETNKTNINELTSSLSDAMVTINQKAPLASPALTGNPTAPTQASTDNSTKIATTAFVKTALANISTKPAVILSTSQPSSTDQDQGGLWLKQL